MHSSFNSWSNFNLDEKTDFNKKTIKIGKSILPLMHYELKNGKIIWKPFTNKRKRKSSSQDIPIEIIENDDSSPQILTTRDLMKRLFGKIEILNEKIDFIAHHLIPDKSKLPHHLFHQDDPDEE